MRSREYIEDMSDTALRAVEADQVEAGVDLTEIGVTRFANSVIHQNTVTDTEEFWARVILGKKIGGISVVSLGKERVAAGMRTALELAAHQKEDPDFRSLPKAKPYEQLEETRRVAPEERAAGVEKMVRVARRDNLTAAGVIYTYEMALNVANSLGVRSYGSTQASYAAVTMMAQDSSGFATQTAREYDEVDCERLANEAAAKALKSMNPVELPPGKYLTLLESPAVAELLLFLNYIGFGARSYQEGTGFMSGRIGEKITGEEITILDDASHPETAGFRFDAEGVPSQKVMLIERGVARNVVYDSYYAHRENRTSTGHALKQPNPYGPYARNLVFAAGSQTKAEMLESMDRGILVTRLWYTRIVDPDKTLVTGMTRDGTFLVENGKIARGIKNLRYTVNILEAFANAAKISDEQHPQWMTGSLAPSVLIKDFNFTGRTEY
jgi:PmbA protein